MDKKLSQRLAQATPALDLAQMSAYLDEIFPEINYDGRLFVVESLEYGACNVRLRAHPKNIRPGGTLSGPAMMTLADYALYVAVLSVVGKVALAVTTNFSIHFLRKPPPCDLMAECSLIKIGKRLCVGDVRLFSAEGAPNDHAREDKDMIAHAVGTYSIPV